MIELKILCLGDFQVSLNEQPIETFESQKVRAILAYLASQAGNIFYRDKLAGLFWPDMPNTNARRNLNQAIYNLRRSLNDRENSSPFLLSSSETIQFNWDSRTWVDVFDFDRFIEKVVTHGESPEALCRECVQRLNQVEQIYRGEFLENLQLDNNNGFEEWVVTRRENIHQKFLNSLSKLITYYENCGQYDLALIYARRKYEFDPLLEKNVRNMMRLLAFSGQRNSALLLYKDLVEALDRELGVQPEQETRELSRQLSEEHAGQILFFTKINSLPNMLTPTIGRDEEISKVCQLLEKPDCRLLTITGVGGSGKTSLGIEVGRQLIPKFRNGISWVDANTLQSVDTLAVALAEALSYPLQKQSDALDQLFHFLKSKEILLIFDGFENRLDGVPLITSILKHAPGCKVLVTSRSRLNLKLEHVYPLRGLSFLAASDNETLYDYSAVRLFLDAALRINPDFQPSQVDLHSIVEICRTVDGMPLGILLSAAWVGVYTPSEIAQEVKDSLNFLNVGWQDLPDRQRSLRASFNYSWRLLSEEERRVAQGLSVFQGRFSRNAAQEITRATAHIIGELESKSLLQRLETGYYRMHELVRFFAREKLAQNTERWQQAYNSHSLYYLNIIQQWDHKLKNANQSWVISEIDVEHENIRAAWDWAVSVRNSDLLIQACEGLCTYYDLRVRFREGKSACEQAVEVVSDETLDYFLIYIWQLHFQRLLNEVEQAEQGLIYCLNMLQNQKNSASEYTKANGIVKYELGMVYMHTDRQQARKYLEDGIAIFKLGSNSWELMHALIALGEILHHLGEFNTSQKHFVEADKIAQNVGETQYISQIYRWQAFNAWRLGNILLGKDLLEESIRFRQQSNDTASLAMSQADYANMVAAIGEFNEAKIAYDKAIPILDHLGFQYEYIRAVFIRNIAELWNGDYASIGKTLDRDLSVAKSVGDQRIEAGLKGLKGQLLFAEGNVTGAEIWLLDSIEQYSQINQADELSGVYAVLAAIYFISGNGERAIATLSKNYQISLQSKGLQGTSFGLFATAVHKMIQGEIETAVQLVSLVCKIPAMGKIIWWQDIVVNPVMQAAEQLPEDVRQAAVVRGLEGNIFEMLPKMAQDLGFGMA